MIALQRYFPVTWLFMSTENLPRNDLVRGDVGEAADRVAVGKDIQQMNVHFDRASNWDPERESLTTTQRLRDLETYVFGDRRGLTIGIMRQMRSQFFWLACLTLFQIAGVIIQVILIWLLLRGSL